MAARTIVPTADGSFGFNTHVRDNLLVLKTSIDDNAKFKALAASWLADLDGSNLTGVVKLAADNSFTGGRHVFGPFSRLRIPVGADKYAGTPGDKTPGSVWVEGDYLHHVDDDQEEWRYLGTLVHTDVAAAAGHIWIEGDAFHYIDEVDGDERVVADAHGDQPELIGA